ncbi:MAG: hypothetical protein QW683_08680 [Candidatus Caldarchaeum sp.]
MKRIVLIDLKPAAYQLESIAIKQRDPVKALETLVSVYHTNGGLIPRPSESVFVLWVADHKLEDGYWRHRELAEIGVTYKDGRTPNPSVNAVVDKIREYIPRHRIISEPGFEADDVIANLVAEWERQYSIDILTCDTDLLQLVDRHQDTEVRWVDTMRYKPIIRDLPNALSYLEWKFKRPFNHPREIVEEKMENGDRSDSLPPGTDRGFIDLRQPLIQCPYRYPGRPVFRPIHLGKYGEVEPIQHMSDHCPILDPTKGCYLWRSHDH